METPPEQPMDLTVLVLGEGGGAASIIEALEAEGFEVETARPQHARQSVEVAVPELVVALGDAVQDGGKEVRANVHSVFGTLPLFVVCPKSKAVLADLWKHAAVGQIDPAVDAPTIARRIAQTMRALEAGKGQTVRDALALVQPRLAPSAAANLPRAPAPAAVAAPLPMPGATPPTQAQPVRSARKEPALVGIAPPPPLPVAVPVVQPVPVAKAAPPALPAPPAQLVELAREAEAQMIREHEAATSPSHAVHAAVTLAPSAQLDATKPREDATPLAWIREHTPSSSDAWQRVRDLAATLSVWLSARASGMLRGRVAVAAVAGTWLAKARALLSSGRALPRMPRPSVPALRWTIAGGALAPVLIALGVVFAGTPSKHARALAPIEVRGSLAAAVPTVAAEPQVEPAAIEAGTPAGEDAVAENADEGEADDEPVGVDGERARQIASANKLVAKGHRLRKAGRLGLAEDAYMSALKALPSYPRAMAGLVRVHLQRRASVEAVRWAKKLVERQPRNGQNQLLLGDAHQLMGAKAEAQKAWRQAARYGNRVARKRLEH